MIVSFVGHSHVPFPEKVQESVKELLKNQIPAGERVTFYLGGRGAFDELCARACREIKCERKGALLVYVTPYISLSEQERIKEMQRVGLCDSSLYPPIEKTPPRFAISKRNEWMMANADLIIAYVNHTYGGAYKSLGIAVRRKKKIINICDFL